MSYVVWYFILLALLLTQMLCGEDFPPDIIEAMERLYSTTNLLIASGTVGICLRLNALIKAVKGAKQ